MASLRGARARQYLVFVQWRSGIRHWIKSCLSLRGTLLTPTDRTRFLLSLPSGSDTATDSPNRLVRKRALSRAQLASLQSGVTGASRNGAGLYEIVRCPNFDGTLLQADCPGSLNNNHRRWYHNRVSLAQDLSSTPPH